MNELQQALVGDSAAAPPAHILEGLPGDLAHRAIEGAPHTIYQELWHITFWQQVTLDWVNGIETPFPSHPSAGFPANGSEPWDQLRERFFQGIQQAAAVAGDENNSISPSAVHRVRAIPSASCRCGNSWRAWRPTMPITSGASSCFANSVEHGPLPREASVGDLG